MMIVESKVNLPPKSVLVKRNIPSSSSSLGSLSRVATVKTVVETVSYCASRKLTLPSTPSTHKSTSSEATMASGIRKAASAAQKTLSSEICPG